MAADEVSEFQANLAEYKDQLSQVEALLLDDAENDEYQAIYQELTEAIGLTEEWLASNAAEASTSEPAAAEAAPRKRRSRFEPMSAASDGINPALPAHLVAQIRFAKARSALQGQGPKSWAVGAACQARYSDGQWYNATVKSLTAEGQYLVNWDGSENHESVDTVDARPRDIADYRGVSAPNRKAVTETAVVTNEVPAWMRAKEGDSEKVKDKKRRALKAYKKKLKFQKMDLSTKAQADNWKNFNSGKGSKKKSGFLSTGKKESMFSVPDNPHSKVGVIGSGSGMTGGPTKRTRLDF